MTWKQVFTSSIGKKLVMSLTGIFLILFLLIHVGLNACIWVPDNGETFNKAAHFMGSMIIPRILEIGLFAGFFLHIIQGYMLTVQNRSKRSVGYAIDYGNAGSKWYSRSMALLGTLILLFLIMHIYHFWTPSRLGGMWNIHPLAEVNYNGKEYHDLFNEMRVVFADNLLIVIIYVLGCISLGYHLAHGFKSSFRTIGVHNNRYFEMIKITGYVFSIVVSLAFAMMPVSYYFGWV
jgi:succinate dehydrogenase / fumarate reductase cytochrome b subunit